MPNFGFNIACCIGVGLVAKILGQLYFPWSNTFVSGASWTVIFGSITVGSLLDWLFPFALFALAGAALALLVRSPKPELWALSLGAIYGLGDFALDLVFLHFYGGPSIEGVTPYIDYVFPWMYPLGGWLGAVVAKAIRRKA